MTVWLLPGTCCSEEERERACASAHIRERERESRACGCACAGMYTNIKLQVSRGRERRVQWGVQKTQLSHSPGEQSPRKQHNALLLITTDLNKTPSSWRSGFNAAPALVCRSRSGFHYRVFKLAAFLRDF